MGAEGGEEVAEKGALCRHRGGCGGMCVRPAVKMVGGLGLCAGALALLVVTGRCGRMAATLMSVAVSGVGLLVPAQSSLAMFVYSDHDGIKRLRVVLCCTVVGGVWC